MREIKFRAWDKIRKYMIHNNTFKYTISIELDGSFVVEKYDDREHSGKNHWWVEKSENYIIMQYTGLKDKNGKEIYEGDIIEFQEMKYEVYYSNTSFKVRPYPYPLHELHRQDGIIYYGCEVIGNIYENPELIE